MGCRGGRSGGLAVRNEFIGEQEDEQETNYARDVAQADRALVVGAVAPGHALSMRLPLALAKVFLSAAAVASIFSLQALTHDAVKGWRCRPDGMATSYEREDVCRPEAWR